MYNSNNGFQPKNCKTGYDFEVWTQGLLTSLGFEANLTGGNDNGVDVIATYKWKGKNYKFYIQCKLYNKTVGKAPIQEVYTGCNYFGGDGYPVVLTNNKMTSEAKAYAKKLGVEVISELQLNELELLIKKQKVVNEMNDGLLGLIMAILTKNKDKINRVIDKLDNTNDIDGEVLTDREMCCNEMISMFDQANILMQESAELQLQSNVCQRQALYLQKEALLKNLRCP